MKRVWPGLVWVALVSSGLTAGAGTVRPHAGTAVRRGNSRSAHATLQAGMPDWQELLWMGTGLCAGSGLCVVQAARLKRSGLLDGAPTAPAEA